MNDFDCLNCNTLFSAFVNDIDDAVCPTCEDSAWVVTAESRYDLGISSMEWNSFVFESAGWGTDEDYGYYGD